MIYVFDDNSLSNVLNHYYADRFPSFWEKFDTMVQNGNIISVREVRLELTSKFNDETIDRLARYNGDFFANPRPEELAFITRIYSIAHFQQNLERKKLLQGGYFADPFIIAKAWKMSGTVVTEENFKEHAAKIPNICKHFDIPCEKLEGFLIKEDWKF
ncbi:hypothetical protein A2V82_10875 [candidate division KSB1 bacterium RBG_16_48_16]|nr:MAG: hypothetical protein A2V82_10875 [candidate division KSB1 bacterium RBG_16_48_16]